MDERFRRDERIRSSKDYALVYRDGGRIRGKMFTLVVRRNDLGHGRLGVVVSRKVGSAVVRNRVKRRCRDIFRRNKRILPGPLDLVILTRPSIAAASRPEIAESLKEALRKIV